jgi:hypothetical protein
VVREFSIDILDMGRDLATDSEVGRDGFIPNEPVLVKHRVLKISGSTSLIFVCLSPTRISCDVGRPRTPKWSRIIKGQFRDVGLR